MSKFKAKKVKDKITDNIKEYGDCKILYKLTKKHSPQSVVFMEDRQDPWLIDVKYYQTKTGEIKDSFTILQSEVEERKNRLVRLGYKVVI